MPDFESAVVHWQRQAGETYEGITAGAVGKTLTFRAPSGSLMAVIIIPASRADIGDDPTSRRNFIHELAHIHERGRRGEDVPLPRVTDLRGIAMYLGEHLWSEYFCERVATRLTQEASKEPTHDPEYYLGRFALTVTRVLAIKGDEGVVAAWLDLVTNILPPIPAQIGRTMGALADASASDREAFLAALAASPGWAAMFEALWPILDDAFAIEFAWNRDTARVLGDHLKPLWESAGIILQPDGTVWIQPRPSTHSS